ncbi:MAG: hypothetical protein H8E35_15865, partial [Ardenticatenia bacterium]|nr:hypothetical protein [Ardenticatenia bacterium]
MSLIKRLRRHLGWKLFLSYLIVILVGMVVLASAAEFVMPGAFEHHLAAMAALMDNTSQELEQDLFLNFRLALNESLILSALAAFLVAVVVSLYVSRRIVTPVLEMMGISQRIAVGHYSEWFNLAGHLAWEVMDVMCGLAV